MNEMICGTLKGIFTLRFVDKDGNTTKEITTDNMVLDSGINHIVTSNSTDYMFKTVIIGSSTANITANITDFGPVIGSSTTITGKEGGVGRDGNKVYFWHRVTYRIPTGQARGTAARIGIKTPNNVLFSCASLVFGNNQATTLDGSELYITYEYRVYHSTAQTTFNNVEIIKGKMYTVKAMLGFDGTNASFGDFGWGQSIAYPLTLKSPPRKTGDNTVLENKPCQWNAGRIGTSTTYAGLTTTDMQSAPIENLDRLTNGSEGTKGFRILFDSRVPSTAKNIGHLIVGTNYGVYMFDISPDLYKINSIVTYQFELAFTLRRA